MLKLLLSILLFFSLQISAQTEIKNYVEHNAVAIKTISPDSINYNDLETIGNAIGDAKIIMLGEQDHGDAPTFLAKTRLIKYLHEKKGFNVLAFESDFFGLNEGWNSINKNEPSIDSFLKKNVLSNWSYCYTCNNLLYNYIPSTFKTKQPFEITGFDNQTDYSFSREHLVKSLDSILQTLNITIIKQENYKTEILPSINALINFYWYKRPDDYAFSDCDNFLNLIKTQAADKLSADDFWMMVINNLIEFNAELRNLKKQEWNAENIRDKQMYLNLKWLIQTKYPDEKIIVWAANNHVSKYESNRYKSMGKFLSEDSALGKQYVIGFTDFEGETGIYTGSNNYKIEKPKKNSLENWLDTSFKYAFIDFRTYNNKFPNNKEKFIMRHWKHWQLSDDWNKIFDGVFYIKEMYPCKVTDENR